MSLPSHGHFANRAWRRENNRTFRTTSRMKSKRHVTGAPGTGNGKHSKDLGKDCLCGGCSTK